MDVNRRHVAIRMSILAAVASAAISADAQARSPVVPSLCTQLTMQMRHSPETVIRDVTSPSPGWRPWVVSANSRQPLSYDIYRRIASAWQVQIGSMPMLGIETLPKADLLMAFGYAGAWDCLSPMFFIGKTADTLHRVRPADASPPCELSEQRDGELATVLGQPTYIESGPLDRNGKDSLLLVVPWSGAAWGPSCTVSIRFTLRYPVRLRYCGPDQAVCSAARQVAPRVERQYEAYSAEWLQAFNQRVPLPKFKFDGALNAPDQALISRAQRIALSTAESRGAPARLLDALMINFDFFPLRLGHTLYLGAATGGVNPADTARWFVPSERYLGEAASTPAPGTLFVVYQAPGVHSHQLQTLAVFSMHQQTSGVESIQAVDDSKRMSPGT